MSVRDWKVQQGEGVAAKMVHLFLGDFAADQSDIEAASIRLPDNCDWYLKEAHIWARAVSGANAKTVNLEDDGTDLGTATTVVAGAQTAITGVSNESIKGGSEVQVKVNTGATTTITALTVSLYFEPLRLYGRQAIASPS